MEVEILKSISGIVALPAGSARLMFKIPIAQLHNVAIKAAGTCYLGGADIETTKGLGMENGDVAAYNWQDFRQDEKGDFEMWGISAAGCNVSFLIWRR
ncbi:MAG: hypothetical protein Q7I94_00615 [Candidatus Contubernalis sp.]|nr:hypothetical protein [Candidatus Contubernalis sp.]